MEVLYTHTENGKGVVRVEDTCQRQEHIQNNFGNSGLNLGNFSLLGFLITLNKIMCVDNLRSGILGRYNSQPSNTSFDLQTLFSLKHLRGLAFHRI